MGLKARMQKIVLAAATLSLAATGLAYGQSKPAPSAAKDTGLVTFTVTAVGKKTEAPTIAMDDVQLFVAKDRKQVANWKPGEMLFLAILIDDSVDQTIAGMWDQLKAFITAQPATTHVAVGYIRNNTTLLAQDFTTDHELAAKALRIPLGTSALGSSPYLGTMDMLKRWPNSDIRRSILLITSGIDYFRGPSYGTFSPDLDGVISRSERQNTNIWSLYYPSAGHRGRQLYVATNAQMNLTKLSDETGGEAYYLSTSAPVTLKPYLDEIQEHLANQYLLTFAGSGGPKGRFQSVKLKTELKNVEFILPGAVFLPPAK